MPGRRRRDRRGRGYRRRPFHPPARRGPRFPQGTGRRLPAGSARKPAAHDRRGLRGHWLRHDPAGRAPAKRQSRPPGPAGRSDDPPLRGGRIRRHRPGDPAGDHGAAVRPLSPGRLGSCVRPPGGHPPGPEDRRPVADGRRGPPAGPVHHPGQPPGLSDHRRPGQDLHRRRRHLPGRAEPQVPRALPARSLRTLPVAPADQSLALPVLPELRRLPAGGLFAGDPGAPERWQDHHPPHRRNPAKGRHAGGGPGPGGRTARRPQGKGRAPHAPGPRPQRRGASGHAERGRRQCARPARAGSSRAGDRQLLRRALQPRHAPGVQRGGGCARGPGPRGRPDGRPARRDPLGRPEGARHGDHRRTRARKARHRLRRGGGIFRRRWIRGHLHRAPHRLFQGRAHAHPGGWRRGGGQRRGR